MENSLEVIKSSKLTLNSTFSALLVKSEVSNSCKKVSPYKNGTFEPYEQETQSL